MRLCNGFFTIPIALITSFTLHVPTGCAEAVAEARPRHLAEGQRYAPEHAELVRRQQIARARIETETPIGMKKMSNDPNEMFFLHYWQFEGDSADSFEPGFGQLASQSDPSDDSVFLARDMDTHSRRSTGFYNSSSYLPPILQTNILLDSSPNRLHPRAIFKRAFQCPTGTYACNSINRPNSCCATSESCQIISISGPNTVGGDVGCCPNGATCGGQIAGCNTAEGYTSCPNSSNGGCCIPGFACQDVGCVASGYTTTTELYVVTVTVTPGQSVVTSTATPSLQPVTTVVTIVQTAVTSTSTPPSPSATPSVLTVYTTLSAPQTTVVVLPSTYALVTTFAGASSCLSSYSACPASVGGGCCPAGYACPTSSGGSLCPPLNTYTTTVSTTVVGVAPPVRPTSDAGTGGIVTVLTTTGPALCPTGYYQCSAYYIGGCCQVNRACDSTNCPSPSSAVVNSDGATVAVPFIGSTQVFTVASGGGVISAASVDPVSTVTVGGSGSSITAAPTTGAAASGQCAGGWYECVAGQPANGCCPTGYSCGGSNCLATAGVADGAPETVARIPVANGAAAAGTRGWAGVVWWVGEKVSAAWMGSIAVCLGAGMVML